MDQEIIGRMMRNLADTPANRVEGETATCTAEFLAGYAKVLLQLPFSGQRLISTDTEGGAICEWEFKSTNAVGAIFPYLERHQDGEWEWGIFSVARDIDKREFKVMTPEGVSWIIQQLLCFEEAERLLDT